MSETTQAITWEAPEHYSTEKSGDWYWMLGIIAVAVAVTAIIFNNTLFGIVILLGTGTLILFAQRPPKTLQFAVTTRGVRAGNELFPYAKLESFSIDEDNPTGPLLIVKSSRIFLPLIVIPIPEEYIDEVDDLVGARLPEEDLEEPLSHRLLEFFGF